AARGERSGLDRQQTNLHRCVLGDCRHGKGGRASGCSRTHEKLTAIGFVNHGHPPRDLGRSGAADLARDASGPNSITTAWPSEPQICPPQPTRLAGSGACSLCQGAKDSEYQRLAFQIVDLDVARGAIDLLPGFREPDLLYFALGRFGKTRREPAVDQVHEGFESLWITATNGIADCMKRTRIRIRQLREQVEDLLTQQQGRGVKKVECAADTALGGLRG